MTPSTELERAVIAALPGWEEKNGAPKRRPNVRKSIIMQSSEHYVVRLLSRFIADPGRVVLWWRHQPTTAEQLLRAVTSAAQKLRIEGFSESSTVALLLDNTPQMLTARYAANLLGATVLQPQTFNAVNPLDQVPVEVQAAMLTESNVTLLITDSANLERSRNIAAIMGTKPRLAVLSAQREASHDILDLSPSDGEQSFDLESARSGDVALVTYTSGSAGHPKGVACTFATLARIYTYYENSAKSPTMLVSTPLHGQTGSTNSDLAFLRDGVVVLLDTFDAGAVLAAIAEYRVTRVTLAPPQLYQLVEHPARPTTDMSSLQQILYQGCAASAPRLVRALEALGPILTQLYGMTEAMGISVLLASEHANPRLRMTVGRPLPQVEVAIRAPDSDSDLEVGETGEVCVRSPFIMAGYWHDPVATARTIRGGWLRTGDLGYMDSDGYLHLVDRLASMIKTRGIKVYPTTIEDVLLSHRAVAQAAVYKVVDNDSVEHVHAAVAVRGGAKVDPDELREHVERNLSATHAPVKISILDTLPLLDTGKPNKRRLSQDAEMSAGWRQPPSASP